MDRVTEFQQTPVVTLETGKVAGWRRSWHAMMASHLPSLDDALSACAETVEQSQSATPRQALDLGGGPGTVTDLLLTRWPQLSLTLLDLDPTLLALARAALPKGVRIHDADLDRPQWTDLIGTRMDVVFAVMTMHYFPPPRLRTLYREIRTLLNPGGYLFVVDQIPARGTPPLGAQTEETPALSTAPQPDWAHWWQALATDTSMAPLLRERAKRFGDRKPAEFTPSAQWHQQSAHAADFARADVIWREHNYAVIAAMA